MKRDTINLSVLSSFFSLFVGFILCSSLFLSLPHVASAQTISQANSQNWPSIKAESAIVYDPISNTILYEKNANTKRGIASIAKIMTAAIAEDILRDYSGIKNTKVVVKKSPNENVADWQLKDGSTWSADELIRYMLIGSSNKASETLSNTFLPRSSFISLMNHKAKEWGLASTSFSNPSGLSLKYKKTEYPGAVSTAKETAHMIWNAFTKYEGVYAITKSSSEIFGLQTLSAADNVTLENTNKLLGHVPIIFGKTGYTEKVGGNLAVIVQDDTQLNPNARPYVIVVLGSTPQGRFDDVSALATSVVTVTPSNATSSGLALSSK